MAFNYQELAKNELSFRGIDPAGLIENYPNQIKRLALDYDMGEVSFQSPVATQIAESATGDDAGRMKAFSKALVEEATFSFPPKAEYFGVDVGGKMADSIRNYLTRNEIKDPDVVLAIPKEHLDKSVYFTAVQLNPNFIEQVPAEFQHYSMQKSAAEDNPELIKVIEKSGVSQLGDEDFLVMIDRHGAKLHHFPDDLKSEALCMKAVQMDGMDLEFVPKDLRSEELCMAAAQENARAIKHVPAEMQSERIQVEVVRNNPHLIDSIDPRMQCEAACMEIVQNNGYNLRIIPDHLRSESVQKAAIQQNVRALTQIPSEERSKELNYFAVMQDRYALSYVPMEEKKEIMNAVINDIAKGNEEAFQVHEQLKSGKLSIGDMSEKQMELMKEINWQPTVIEVHDAHTSFDEAFSNASAHDSSWMSSMERSGDVLMESQGGLRIEFGINTESANPYGSVETLRDLYDCNLGVDGNASVLVGEKQVNPSDMVDLSDALRSQWESQALQELGQMPAEYEAIADRTFADLAIDNTLSVSRDNLDEIAISFSVEDPYRDGGVDFTMKAGDPESLTFIGQEPSEAGMSLAETYVAENEQMLAAEVGAFKLQEVGLSKIEVDYETVEGAGQVYFATFENNGESGYVGLDSETLKIDSESEGYSQLSEAQVEVLSAELEKHTEGMTPPMGIEMAQRKAEELSELTGNNYTADSNSDETGYSVYDVDDAGGDHVQTTLIGCYESATDMNRDLDSKILEARESITIERDEPKQEVERERQEEPERRGVRI